MKKPSQSGFSLLELLVVAAILIVVIVATLDTLSQAVNASQAVSAVAQVQDGARASLNIIVRDLVQAGSGLPTGGVPIPYTASGSPGPVPLAINRPSPPGFKYTFPVAQVLTSLTPGAGLGLASLGHNTDMITIIYADNTLPWTTMAPVNNPKTPKCAGTLAADGSSATFDTTTKGCATLSGGNVSVLPGDLIMFSSANANAMEVVTNVNGSVLTFAAGDAFNLNGNAADSGTMAQLQSPPGTYPPTSAIRIWMISYYIDNTTNPKDPRLMRQVNFNPPQILSDDIEDLQFAYDVINAVATVPANDARAPVAPDSPNQIRKVDVYLSARSDQLFSQTGQPFRTNLWTQVSSRSLSFVSRYN
ncbi:MAG: prepilin-type N-terminal cleavage/methylation domain-containing protein [Candidatus Acidiferrales bacterium]